MYGEINKLGIYYSRFGTLFTFPLPTPKNGWEVFIDKFEAAIQWWNSPDIEEPEDS